MPRHLGQKIALAFAGLSYLAAVGCLVGALVYDSEAAGEPVRAALLASIVFFVGCGVVLQVIGTARLKGVLSGGQIKKTAE